MLRAAAAIANFFAMRIVDTPTALTLVDTAPVIDIAIGRHNLCVIRDGNVWCWARGDSGQLGIGTAMNHASPVEPVHFP